MCMNVILFSRRKVRNSSDDMNGMGAEMEGGMKAATSATKRFDLINRLISFHFHFQYMDSIHCKFAIFSANLYLRCSGFNSSDGVAIQISIPYPQLSIYSQ